jgi:hypothetical protein
MILQSCGGQVRWDLYVSRLACLSGAWAPEAAWLRCSLGGRWRLLVGVSPLANCFHGVLVIFHLCLHVSWHTCVACLSLSCLPTMSVFIAGSPEMVAPLTAIDGVYFSISGGITRIARGKAAAMLGQVYVCYGVSVCPYVG